MYRPPSNISPRAPLHSSCSERNAPRHAANCHLSSGSAITNKRSADLVKHTSETRLSRGEVRDQGFWRPGRGRGRLGRARVNHVHDDK